MPKKYLSPNTGNLDTATDPALNWYRGVVEAWGVARGKVIRLSPENRGLTALRSALHSALLARQMVASPRGKMLQFVSYRPSTSPSSPKKPENSLICNQLNWGAPRSTEVELLADTATRTSYYSRIKFDGLRSLGPSRALRVGASPRRFD